MAGMLYQKQAEVERRKALATALNSASEVKVANPFQGLAKAVLMGVGGYQTGKFLAGQSQLESEKREALAKALSGGGTREQKIAGLAGVPGYEDTALKASLEKPDMESLAFGAMTKQAQGQPLSPQEQAQLTAFQNIKGAEVGMDMNGQTYRKYDFGSGQPQQPTTSAQAPQGAPAVEQQELPPTAPQPSAALSPQDREAVIRTIIGEAEGQGPDSWAGVAHTIRNRMSAGTFGGTSATEVVKAPKQFSPWGDPAAQQRMMSYAPDSEMYQKVASVVDDVFAGKMPDNTNGAVNFYSPGSMPNGSTPSWAAGRSVSATTPGFQYYAPPQPKGLNPIGVKAFNEASGKAPVDIAKKQAETAIDTANAGPKKFAEQTAGNLADTAAPKPADNNVPKMTNALALLEDMKALNDTAYDGYVKGPATQLAGRIFGDNFLTPEQQQSRNAFSQFEQKSTALQAEALKPTVGGSQISNADVNFVGKAVSVLPTASRDERRDLLSQIGEVLQRRRDIEALEQQAAQAGRTFGPADVAAYYASKGIDFNTGARTGGAPAAQSQPQSLTGLTNLPQGFKDLGNGKVQGPDGQQYEMRPR